MSESDAIGTIETVDVHMIAVDTYRPGQTEKAHALEPVRFVPIALVHCSKHHNDTRSLPAIDDVAEVAAAARALYGAPCRVCRALVSGQHQPRDE